MRGAPSCIRLYSLIIEEIQYFVLGQAVEYCRYSRLVDENIAECARRHATALSIEYLDEF